MTTRLPPPPRPLPVLRPSDLFGLPAGTPMGRLYFAAGAHPNSWNQFRRFGPVATMRFDHQAPPPRINQRRAVCYVAPALGRPGGTMDPLHTCTRESFAATGTIDLSSDEPWFVVWAPTRELRLTDVVDSPWIARAGGNAAISSGDRGMSRRWSRRIYEEYPDVDGLYYEAATLPAYGLVMLFERARDALPPTYLLNMPLNHAGLRPALKRIAWEYGMRLVL